MQDVGFSICGNVTDRAEGMVKYGMEAQQIPRDDAA